MKSPENLQAGFSEQTAQQGWNVDIKRVLYRVVRFWYVVALLLGVAFFVGYLANRYATRVYPITASILIKEKEQSSEGRLLYNNPLVSGFRNYLNEIYLLRSYPFVERALKDLNFGVSFYKEGRVLTTESYDLPFTAQIVDANSVRNFNAYFEPLNGRQYRLRLKHSSEENGEPAVFSFNDTITFKGLRIVFFVNDRGKADNFQSPDPIVFTYQDPAAITSSYVSRLKVSWAEQGSGVLNLSINGSQPEKEIDFLNGLIAQYQLFDLEKKNAAASRSIEFISEQLEGITDSLKRVERQLERFKDRNVMTDLSMEAGRLASKLEALEGQRAEFSVRRNYYDYLSEYLKQSTDLDQIILPSSVGLTDGLMSSLIQQMVDLQMQLKMNTRSENPLARDAKRKVDEIRRDIIEAVKNQQSTDKIREDFLNKQVQEIERQLEHLPVAERQLVSIERNYSLLENLYIFLLQKRAEAGISKASTTTDIEVVNPPRIAGVPISPKPLQNYLIAVLLGLGLPVGAFVLLELLTTKVQSREDIEKVTTIPFIGGVGHKSTASNLEVLTHPKTAVAESFRALRANLSYFLGKHEKAVIMVTSSISGEGKSFTSINLASVLNLSEKRVLIIGADMRRPKLYDDFNLSNEKGLSSYLSGIAGFTEVVQSTSYKNLDLVSGGPVPPNPAELLLTNRMRQFVKEARERYDYVIIDTPPMAIVTDAFVMSELADHTLFLVRQNYTPKALLKTAEDFYRSGKLRNISLVLNDIYRNAPGYGYGYGYGYSYGYAYGYSGKSKNGYGYYSQ